MNQERLKYLTDLIKSDAISLPSNYIIGKSLKEMGPLILPIKEKFDPRIFNDGEIPATTQIFKKEVIKYEELGQLITLLNLPPIKAPDVVPPKPSFDFYPVFPNISFYPTLPNFPTLNPDSFVYISGIEEPLTYELNEEAPLEELTPVAKSIWEAIWPEPFPDIYVIWGEDDWAPNETMGDWTEEKRRIRISFNNHIRGYRGEDEIHGKRNTGLIYTIVHELLHVRGYQHDTYGLSVRQLDKVHDIYALEVEKALNILWEKIK